jgi:hypothetical protein
MLGFTACRRAPAPSSACSATAEGFDATFGKTKEQLLVVDRRRPARLITGEGKLLPLVRDGSTMEVSGGSCPSEAWADGW